MSMDPFGGFGSRMGFSFMLFEGLFFVTFLIVLAVIVIVLVKSLSTWSKNNNSPLLKVNASVVAKRDKATVHRGTMSSEMHMRTGTRTHHDYYVTFQVESGDRLELEVPESEYGCIIEGDKGVVSFKGTRFVAFEREK